MKHEITPASSLSNSLMSVFQANLAWKREGSRFAQMRSLLDNSQLAVVHESQLRDFGPAISYSFVRGIFPSHGLVIGEWNEIGSSEDGEHLFCRQIFSPPAETSGEILKKSIQSLKGLDYLAPYADRLELSASLIVGRTPNYLLKFPNGGKDKAGKAYPLYHLIQSGQYASPYHKKIPSNWIDLLSQVTVKRDPLPVPEPKPRRKKSSA